MMMELLTIYSCESMKKLHEYQLKFSDELQRKHIERYGKKVVSFRTILEQSKNFKLKKNNL